jgi:hypothetical protein
MYCVATIKHSNSAKFGLVCGRKAKIHKNGLNLCLYHKNFLRPDNESNESESAPNILSAPMSPRISPEDDHIIRGPPDPPIVPINSPEIVEDDHILRGPEGPPMAPRNSPEIVEDDQIIQGPEGAPMAPRNSPEVVKFDNVDDNFSNIVQKNEILDNKWGSIPIELLFNVSQRLHQDDKVRLGLVNKASRKFIFGNLKYLVKKNYNSVNSMMKSNSCKFQLERLIVHDKIESLQIDQCMRLYVPDKCNDIYFVVPQLITILEHLLNKNLYKGPNQPINKREKSKVKIKFGVEISVPKVLKKIKPLIDLFRGIPCDTKSNLGNFITLSTTFVYYLENDRYLEALDVIAIPGVDKLIVCNATRSPINSGFSQYDLVYWRDTPGWNYNNRCRIIEDPHDSGLDANILIYDDHRLVKSFLEPQEWYNDFTNTTSVYGPVTWKKVLLGLLKVKSGRNDVEHELLADAKLEIEDKTAWITLQFDWE